MDDQGNQVGARAGEAAQGQEAGAPAAKPATAAISRRCLISARTSRPEHHAPDITPRTVIGDKGYDGKGNRKAARRRGICPAIPYRRNATAKPKFFPRALYKARLSGRRHHTPG